MSNLDYSALEFEILDVAINASPDIFVNATGITFTKRVLEDLGYPTTVQFGVLPQYKLFSVRACKSNESKAAPFSKPKTEQKNTVSIGNHNVIDPVRKMMEGIWEDGQRYKVTGHYVPDSRMMVFELTEGVKQEFRVPKPEATS